MDKDLKNISQRDAFLTRLYELAKDNRDIVLVSADMGAPALDRFRRDLGSQFINTGIAEQNTILLSAGLAMGGKKVFAMAIAPFIALRGYELIKINLAGMKLPVTLIAIGAGISYSDSGPTHHAIEDVSVMHILANMTVNTATDSVMAAGLVDYSMKLEGPHYVRLDRGVLPSLYQEGADFSQGFTVLKPIQDVNIVANGNMVHRALELHEELKKEGWDVGVIDLYKLPINEKLLEVVGGSKKLITIEEHTLPGGLGSAVAEFLADNDKQIPLKRFGFDFRKGYCYKYGGREHILSTYGLDKESLRKEILRLK